MVKYLRSNVKKVNSAFVIEPFGERKHKNENKKVSLVDNLNIGMYLVTPLLSGVVLGILLDNRFKTKPVFVLIGIFFGVAGSFYNLIKVVKSISNNA